MIASSTFIFIQRLLDHKHNALRRRGLCNQRPILFYCSKLALNVAALRVAGDGPKLTGLPYRALSRCNLMENRDSGRSNPFKLAGNGLDGYHILTTLGKIAGCAV